MLRLPKQIGVCLASEKKYLESASQDGESSDLEAIHQETGSE